jgi:nucleoside-diphosphate-sugar epimerase
VVRLSSAPFLVSDAKARRELGYQPLISREQGLREFAQA